MSGATSHKVSWFDRLRTAVKLHKNNSIGTLLDILRQPGDSLLTILVLAIALALPGIFYIMTSNAKALSNNWDSSMQMALFLSERTSEQQAQKLVQELSLRPEFSAVSYKSKAEALEEFKTYSGFSEALDALEQNPLPMMIELVPDESQVNTEQLTELVAELEQNRQVEAVQLDMEWVNKYQAIIQISEKIGKFISGLLAVGVLLIVGNTIRLAILNRREEIQVIKLVGATDAFIRRPFLYTGFWYGLLAGVIAALMISILSKLVAQSADKLAELYQSSYQLLGLSVSQTLYLILIGALLGLMGSWISVRRHLKEIQPT